MRNVSAVRLCCCIAPNPKIGGSNYSNISNICGCSQEEFGLKGNSLHAADLVSRVKVFKMEEVQQHLRHVVVLIDDVLASQHSSYWLKWVLKLNHVMLL